MYLKFLYKIKDMVKRIVPESVYERQKEKVYENNLKKLKRIIPTTVDLGVRKKGINLVGSINGEFGLGQSCRLIANILKNSEINYSIYEYNYSKAVRERDEYAAEIKQDMPYGINLIHINPLELKKAFLEMPGTLFEGRYNVAYWLWELEEFPDEMTEYIPLLDEIWTPAEFISKAIRKRTDKPVITVPYSVIAPINIDKGRTYFKLPEKQFLYLIMYDTNSIIERKNPEAAIEAFKKAFSPREEGIGFVVKVNNASKEHIEGLQKKLKGYLNVYFILENLEKEQVNSLISLTDVVVSLHRAEGFGLIMAEAMLLGTPVIATNWSANTEFMNEEVSCLVDYKLIQITEDIGPYKKGQHWAEADVDMASMYMKKLYTNKEFYKIKSMQGKKYIEKKLGLDSSVTILVDRVKAIWKDNI